MRLYLADSKENIIIFLYQYLVRRLENTERRIVINGKELVGVIENIKLDDDKSEWLKLYINDDVFTIPLNNDSKIRLDKGLFFFETDSHTALIYV